MAEREGGAAAAITRPGIQWSGARQGKLLYSLPQRFTVGGAPSSLAAPFICILSVQDCDSCDHWTWSRIAGTHRTAYSPTRACSPFSHLHKQPSSPILFHTHSLLHSILLASTSTERLLRAAQKPKLSPVRVRLSWPYCPGMEMGRLPVQGCLLAGGFAADHQTVKIQDY